MPQNLLTDKALRALKPGAKETTHRDGGGLWVRVLPKASGGAISFYYRFERENKERRFNCGSYPETSLADARKRRDAARALVSQGIDPVQNAKATRAANAAAQLMQQSKKTVQGLFEDWKKVYLSAHRRDGGKSVEQLFKKDVFPIIGVLKAKTVRVNHVVQIIDKILARNARRTANMALSSLRQMFRHGLNRGYVELDPTLTLTKKQAGGTAAPIDRNLSIQEIKELATKLPISGMPKRLRAAIWLLLATGARVGELSKSRWAEFDLTKKTWQIPAANAKNGRPHLVHLSKFAIKHIGVLSELAGGDYVLDGRSSGSAIDVRTISKAIRDRIRAKPLPGRTSHAESLLLSGGEWSVHDLRRTFASRLGDLGIAPHIIERCLNHVQAGIVKVYHTCPVHIRSNNAYQGMCTLRVSVGAQGSV